MADPADGAAPSPGAPTSAAGVDVGGTFTDVVVVGQRGRPRAVKVPTTPDDQGEGVAVGILAAVGTRTPPLVAHGTTTATNAILERRVARTALVTTQGFADVLVIGRQNRPALYDLTAVRPEPLVPPDLVVTAVERIDATGGAVIELDDAEVTRVADAVAALAPESVALSLLFSFANPVHERRLADALRGRLGDLPITCSSALLPELREYERTSTCVLNAAVAPVMRRYLGRLADRLPRSAVTVMTSGGGTADLEHAAEAPVHTLLSGPAAGAVAAGAVAVSAGFMDAVALDMGGTSTDVCLIREGRPTVSAESAIGGLPFRTPAVDIHTVGAGGGSLADVDAGGALRVGPRSAGARPGPACYGFGGTGATVTDAHCVLGHLDPDRALGTDGAVRLDAEAARRALAGLARDLGLESPEEAARGVLTVVRATMSRALRRVTTERGVDPTGLVLVAYGGAGPLHAVDLAAELGCAAVVIPPAPGVLSALGLLLAPPRHESARTVMLRLPADDHAEQVWAELADSATDELQGQSATGIRLRRLADCRYAGQSHELRVEAAEPAALVDSFHAAHHTSYGYDLPNEPIDAVTLRVVAEGDPVLAAPPVDWDQGPAGPPRRRVVGLASASSEVQVLDRASLRTGDRVEGPAVVEQPDSTVLLDRGDLGAVDDSGNLVVRRLRR